MPQVILFQNRIGPGAGFTQGLASLLKPPQFPFPYCSLLAHISPPQSRSEDEAYNPSQAVLFTPRLAPGVCRYPLHPINASASELIMLLVYQPFLSHLGDCIPYFCWTKNPSRKEMSPVSKLFASPLPKHFLVQNKHLKNVCWKDVEQVDTPCQTWRGWRTRMQASRGGKGNRVGRAGVRQWGVVGTRVNGELVALFKGPSASLPRVWPDHLLFPEKL